MSAKFKLKPIASAVLPLIFAGNMSVAIGQEADNQDTSNKKDKESDVEVIEVKGYRGSLQKSIAEKRLAESISDSIFAEDIGKSTDQNIADALGRVTGVSVQQSDGEGTRISVRGAGANLNQISLNGVALTSSLSGGGGAQSESEQSVDLSAFSSDILSSINVIKTAAADHDEGSLGANVILKTVKPLNVKDNKRVFEVQGRYNEMSDDADHKVSGTFSQKLFDDSFGFILTVADETQGTRTDSLDGDWLAPYVVADVRAGGATSLQTGLPTEEAQKAIIANSRGYSTSLNRRDRQTATLGLQLQPFDTTDIQLDISYSKQTVEVDNHRLSIRIPDLDNDGNYTIGDTNHVGDAVDFNDPQSDWWTIDEETSTLVKALNRNGTGSLGRVIGGNETENNVATLTIQQEITDDLLMEIKAGYSKTAYEALPNASLNTAHWNTVPVAVTKATPLEDLEPIGYDCTTGACQIAVGTQPFQFIPTGNSNGSQNIATSGFNPLDPHAHHLGYVAKYNEETTDINKTLFVDFDYMVDDFGITSIEFGAKVSNRVKDVYTDYQTIQGSGQTLFDPVTGLPLSAGGVSDVAMVDVIQGSGLPIDNFMDGIAGDYGYNNDFLSGWGILDPEKAFSEIFQVDDIELIPDTSGSRDIEQDNVSLYGKLNFELMDGRLTGNIGARYVKTEHITRGNPVVKFFNGDRIFDANELIYDKQLANTDLMDTSPCPEVSGADDWAQREIPTTEPCYDPLISPDDVLLVTYDANGEVVSIDRNDPSTRGWWVLFRHGDQTTMKKNGEAIYPDDPDKIWRRTYEAEVEHSSDLVLPSLNLNFQVTDALITRFAASTTMARPKFDSLRPGFSYDETVWGDGVSRATVFNPYLEPLKSNNLDFSAEWYFGDTDMISIALFDKDMTDLEEKVTDRINYLDIRDDYDRTSLTWDEFAMPMAEGQTPQTSECMPARIVQDKIRNPLSFACDELRMDYIRNGSGASIRGVEVSYSQDYDFLPGVLSGLGASVNYTYQDSETDSEVIELTGNELKSLPVAYTPKHSANTTIFWEKGGHQIRLAHRYTGIQLAARGRNDGAEWKDATNNVDLSMSYKFSENITFSLHALNLTNETHRTFFTSTSMDLGEVDGDGNTILLDEGNALDGDVDTSRTIREWKTGRQYRLTARINF